MFMVIYTVLVLLYTIVSMQDAPSRNLMTFPDTTLQMDLSPAGNPLAGAFYRNQGQIVDTEKRQVPELEYYALFNGARVYFTSQGWHTVYMRSHPVESPVSEATGRSSSGTQVEHAGKPQERLRQGETALYRMDMVFIGCNTDVEIEAGAPLMHYLRYYLPHCMDGVGRVPAYGTLRYRNLYDNIDLILYAAREGLKYEFEVRPGGRIHEIRMRHAPGDGAMPMADGSVRMRWPGGFTLEGPPLTYSLPDGDDSTPAEIRSAYVVEGNVLGFAVDPYPDGQTVIIDPWSTYFGGQSMDAIFDITCGAAPGVVATGWTQSVDFPVHQGWQMQYGGGHLDGLIVKFDSTNNVGWATYFGGDASDESLCIAGDHEGNVIIGGSTYSDDLPVHDGFQMSHGGWNDGFVAKFDSTGARLWASYVGGDYMEYVYGIATDAAGNIYLTGSTGSDSAYFPVRNAYQTQKAGVTDGFYMKLTKDGGLLFSSYLGGVLEDTFHSIAVDPAGRFALGGQTSGAFPTLQAEQSVFGGETDGIIGLFDSSGTPVWISYHGGSSYESGQSVSFDADGNILFCGNTASVNFPLRHAVQDTLAGFSDMFVSKFDLQGRRLWSTFHGGDGGMSSGIALATDSERNVYVVGETSSHQYPVRNAAFPTMSDSGPTPRDAIVVKYDSAGLVEWATYLGGNKRDAGQAVAIDSRGYLYVAGHTASADFPVYNAVQDTIGAVVTPGGLYSPDGFITRFRTDGSMPVTVAQLSVLRVADGIELVWMTENEITVKGFLIERDEAVNGSPVWTEMAFVPSAGDSASRHTYRYVDVEASDESRDYRYRLRIVHKSGGYDFSPEVRISSTAPSHSLIFDPVYPSPARDWVTLRFTLPDESSVTLLVHDIAGREIVRIHDGDRLARGTHRLLIPVSPWRSGLYIATLAVGDTQSRRRVMVLR